MKKSAISGLKYRFAKANVPNRLYNRFYAKF